jgi:hypothetical protein
MLQISLYSSGTHSTIESPNIPKANPPSEKYRDNTNI